MLNAVATTTQTAAPTFLDNQHLENCCQHTTSIAAHNHLFHEGDEATHFYEVVAGAFCVYKLLPDGRRYIVSFALPGDLVGFGADDQYELNAEAINDSTVRPVSFSRIEQAIAVSTKLAKTLLRYAKYELADAQDRLVTVGRKSAMERMATFLTRLSERNSKRGEDAEVVRLPMTRADIADFLGLTLETVSRTLSKLKRAGIIDLPQSSMVVIRDKFELETLAEI